MKIHFWILTTNTRACSINCAKRVIMKMFFHAQFI
ncbi:unnamed protein product [Larinioides sclopetarius]|uniref:Uncharacterized protein n=1 Tax=Larinioides sclopetarius TaxID=280406 RepID=A0AAV2ABF9_9ARAC